MINKKILTIGSVILMLSIVYAIFSTNLNITGRGEISSKWDVVITNVTVSKSNNNISANYIINDKVSASFNTILKKPGDKVEYTITVSNKGTIDAIINKVNININETSFIKYRIEDLQASTRLSSNSDINFKFIVEYDSNLTSIPDVDKEIIDIIIECIQDD